MDDYTSKFLFSSAATSYPFFSKIVFYLYLCLGVSFLKILIFKTKLKVLEKKQDLYHGLTCEASVSNRDMARKLVIPLFFALVPTFLDELARKRLLRRLILASRLLGAYNSRTKPQPSPPPTPPGVAPLLKRDLTNFESRDLWRESAIFRIKKCRIIL